MLKVLVDNCVLSDAVLKDAPKKAQSDASKRHELSCIPLIAEEARKGRIQLCTYWQIEHESWDREGSYPFGPDGSMFGEVDFQWVDAAIEKSFFFFDDPTKDSFKQFCKWLNECDAAEFARRVSKKPGLPAFQLQGIQEIARYQEICKQLKPERWGDALHFWTAERNGCDYFLTTDKRFTRQFRAKVKSDICKVVFPSELVAILEAGDGNGGILDEQSKQSSI